MNASSHDALAVQEVIEAAIQSQKKWWGSSGYFKCPRKIKCLTYKM